MKLHQDIKMVKLALIEQRWMLDKIWKQREDGEFKERSYNRLIIQIAYFFKNISRDKRRQLC